MNPFKIDSPTCISFSGGRTSAYMLNLFGDEETIACFCGD
jgi:predicted phosphoadenosine phosphosulfate sulfurtransferase